MIEYLEERQTAGKRIKVCHLHNPGYEGNPDLESLIQQMADQGYNFAGLINKHIPTGTFGWPSYDYLFIKAQESMRIIT